MKMNFQYGKIYKITSKIGNLVYIGSTTQRYLSSRFATHSYNSKIGTGCSSAQLFQFPDVKIELVELLPCESKLELKVKEGKITRETECVNKNIAGRTPAVYYQDNKTKIDARTMELRNKNKENYLIYQKNYREKNKLAKVNAKRSQET